MGLLGKDGVVQVSTDDVNYYDVVGCNSINFNPSFEKEDVTSFDAAGAGAGDYDEVHEFISKLTDGSFALSGFFQDDTTGQDVLRKAVNSGIDVYIKVLWDGSNGHKCQGLVSRFGSAGPSSGVLTFNCDVVFNGAWSAV